MQTIAYAVLLASAIAGATIYRLSEKTLSHLHDKFRNTDYKDAEIHKHLRYVTFIGVFGVSVAAVDATYLAITAVQCLVRLLS